ncbi:PEP/pyruvate-binding domain-containing protein [Micromonospora violae]|uniref:PEP/pyruvate-binding domain-containing protein n=1 Tax=Micromonospora violae TaxID=1278207 RepID=UPI0033E6E75F
MAALLTDLSGPATEVGGKAFGLRVAHAHGWRVPPTAVIPATAVPQSGEADPSWLRQSSMEIAAWARDSGVSHLVVRSSAEVEDQAAHSYAGVFGSAFSRLDPVGLTDALTSVIASTRSATRAAYEDAVGLPRSAGRMAIVVQATVPARSSGVAFGWHTPDGPQLLVEGTWGLAVHLVEGISAGDSHRSGPAGGHRVRPKPLAVYPVPDHAHRPGDVVVTDHGFPAKVVYVDEPAGLAYVRLPPALAERDCLHPGLLAELERLVGRPVPGCSGGVDVEWVEDANGTVWLVQLRPLTARPTEPTAPDRRREPTGTLRGEPGAPGTWRGPVSSPAGIGRYTPADGRVLLCGAARPELLPAIARAAAIVSTDGGVLCHIAIVARELGKPCVIGIHEAATALPEDMVVTVDGTAGTVRAAPVPEDIDRPAEPADDASVGFLPPDQPPDPADEVFTACDVVVLILTRYGPVAPAALAAAPDHLVVVATTEVAETLCREPGWRLRQASGGWSLLARGVDPDLLRRVCRLLSVPDALQ